MGFWGRNFPITVAAIQRLRRARRELRMLQHLQKARRLADSIGRDRTSLLIDHAILANPDSTNKNGS